MLDGDSHQPDDVVVEAGAIERSEDAVGTILQGCNLNIRVAM